MIDWRPLEPDLVERFQQRQIRLYMPLMRVGVLAAAFLPLVFLMWDALLAPERLYQTMLIRGAICLLTLPVFWLLREDISMRRANGLFLYTVLLGQALVTISLGLVPHGMEIGLPGMLLYVMGAAVCAPVARPLFLMVLPTIAIMNGVMIWTNADSFVYVNAHFFALPFLAMACLLGLFVELMNRSAFRLELTLEREANTDTLTGAANRRHIFSIGNETLGSSRTAARPMTLLLIDIDHFKRINDTFGHETGDRAIQALVATVTANLRRNDRFGRVGGEEFVAILPETSVEDATILAERLRMAVRNSLLDIQGRRLNFTISIGVASASGDDRAIDDLINRADKALYRAKNLGRDRVERAESEPLAVAAPG